MAEDACLGKVSIGWWWKMKLLITNLVYGETYARIFLDQHLKSLLDPSNVPSYKDRLEYLIFTDAETRILIEDHPNFLKLQQHITVGFVLFEWTIPEEMKFQNRYSKLMMMFKDSVEIAMEHGRFLSAWVADLVIAKDFFAKLFSRLDYGHDSVFVLPLRAAMEGTHNSLRRALDMTDGALSAEELCQLGYTNLHPLWVACHWRAAQFTRLPFSLLWNSGTGLLARSYSITPIAFLPTKEMQHASDVIDAEIPSLCKNPYWATDWIDCPVIGVEPIQCFYPTFANHTSNIEHVKTWANGVPPMRGLHASQKQWLDKKLYYPSREVVCSDTIKDFGMHAESDTVVRELMK
jgi:hypothetical protein